MAAETSVRSAPYCLDTPLSFVSRHQHPCIWYAGLGRLEATSDGLVASTSTEVQVAIIPLTIGSIVGRLLVSFSEVEKFLSRDRGKIWRLETLESR